MALNTFKYNHLTRLRFKGLIHGHWLGLVIVQYILLMSVICQRLSVSKRSLSSCCVWSPSSVS